VGEQLGVVVRLPGPFTLPWADAHRELVGLWLVGSKSVAASRAGEIVMSYV